LLGYPAVVVAAGVVVVVVVMGKVVLLGENSRHGGFTGPLPASDPESAMQGREWVPTHGESVLPARLEIKSCSSRSILIVYS
jgi:hypothetical protein